jgi:glycosyltransferase involved in cell wall biosynthesis
MKVVQVLNHFLPQHAAGTEIYTWALSKRLLQKGIDVEVVIPNYGNTSSEQYVYDGLKVFKYAEPSVVNRSLIMGFRTPDGLANFEEYLADVTPDIVHFHEMAGSSGIGLQHVLTAKHTGAKVIMTFHLAGNSCKTGNLFYKETEPCDGLIDVAKCSACYLHGKASQFVAPLLYPLSLLSHKWGVNTTSWQNQTGTALGTAFLIDELKQRLEVLVQHCDKVIVLAQWYEKILVANGVPKEKISYVPQALPLDAVSRSEPQKERVTTALRLIFLGRIDPLKGLHLLLQALMAMPERQIELDIYGQFGDTAYETEWRKKTATHNGITWKGRLKQENVISTMQQYDALCLPSTFSEMSPLVIQEAFAAGVPVIASNVYGNAEQIVHEKNGLLFRFKDAVSLREQLLRCINEPELLRRMRNNIKPPRRFDEVANDYLQIYQTVLARYEPAGTN